VVEVEGEMMIDMEITNARRIREKGEREGDGEA
jgi:hypothetical protein